jgi:DeoR/GlpR family transcriptional regulator of sugar metabolism
MRAKQQRHQHEEEKGNEKENEVEREVTARHRRFEILEIVYNTEEKVRTGDLATRFGIGQNLLAHDLRILEEMGLIERGHGWVRRRATEIEDLFQKTEYAAREKRHPKAKRAIARYIAQHLIEEGDDLLLDAGTTALEIGKQLLYHEKRCVITTNNLPLALHLGRNAILPLYLVGGSYSRAHAATVGPEAAEQIEGKMADVAILTPRSLALVDPYTAQAAEHCGAAVERALGQLSEALGHDPAPEEVFYFNLYEEDPLQYPYKGTLIKNSNRLIIAADHSKWTFSGKDFFALLIRFAKLPAAGVRTRGPVRTRGAVAQLAPPQASLDIDVRDPVDLREPGSVTIVTNAESNKEPPQALVEMIQALPGKLTKGFLQQLEQVIVVVDTEGRPIEGWTQGLK